MPAPTPSASQAAVLDPLQGDLLGAAPNEPPAPPRAPESPSGTLEPPACPSPVSVNHSLPQAIAATTLVAVFPTAFVWYLQGIGLIGPTVLSALLATVLSLVVSYTAERYWRARSASNDLLFSELMIWGWIRRWWAQRQLGNGEALFRGLNEQADISHEQRVLRLRRLATALELSDPYTHGHSRRVARYSAAIAERMGLPKEAVAKIRLAALLHDVGKVSTPAGVLQKPGRLDDLEFDAIRRHPGDGAAMVSILGDPELTAMVRHHHERLEGTGYPDGLKGEEIPLGARIIAVADTFDAITSTRPYRPANSHKRAMNILKLESGVQLDPYAVLGFKRQYAGRRTFMIWVAFTSFLPQRLLSLLGGGANVAVASTARVMAATAMTSAIASAAVVEAAPLHRSPHNGPVAIVHASSPAHPKLSVVPVVTRRTARHRAVAVSTPGHPAKTIPKTNRVAAPAGHRVNATPVTRLVVADVKPHRRAAAPRSAREASHSSDIATVGHAASVDSPAPAPPQASPATPAVASDPSPAAQPTSSTPTPTVSTPTDPTTSTPNGSTPTDPTASTSTLPPAASQPTSTLPTRPTRRAHPKPTSGTTPGRATDPGRQRPTTTTTSSGSTAAPTTSAGPVKPVHRWSTVTVPVLGSTSATTVPVHHGTTATTQSAQPGSGTTATNKPVHQRPISSTSAQPTTSVQPTTSTQPTTSAQPTSTTTAGTTAGTTRSAGSSPTPPSGAPTTGTSGRSAKPVHSAAPVITTPAVTVTTATAASASIPAAGSVLGPVSSFRSDPGSASGSGRQRATLPASGSANSRG